jgi:Uma2 family endonuclease
MEVYFVDPDQERKLAGRDIQAWLEERRELGLDRRDEVWDGVYHVVPSASSPHQLIEAALLRVLYPIVSPSGLEVVPDLDVLHPQRGDHDYRQPDISVVDPADLVHRGINGHAELVIEILSPNDESRKKAQFYAACRIPELWLLDPTSREIEVYRLKRARYVRVVANADGEVVAPRFGLTLQVVASANPRLLVRWPGGSAEI